MSRGMWMIGTPAWVIIPFAGLVVGAEAVCNGVGHLAKFAYGCGPRTIVEGVNCYRSNAEATELMQKIEGLRASILTLDKEKEEEKVADINKQITDLEKSLAKANDNFYQSAWAAIPVAGQFLTNK